MNEIISKKKRGGEPTLLSSDLIAATSFRGEPCCTPLASISNRAHVFQSRRAVPALFSVNDTAPSKPERQQLILEARFHTEGSNEQF